MSTKKLERAYLENQGMEKILTQQLIDIEAQRQTFIRQFIKVQENLKIEALKKKDEVFRIKLEKDELKQKLQKPDKFLRDDRDLLLPKEIYMSRDHTSFHTNGLLNCPGIQSRYNRAQNISRIKLHFNDVITDSDDVTDSINSDVVSVHTNNVKNDTNAAQNRPPLLRHSSDNESRDSTLSSSPWQPSNTQNTVAPKLGFRKTQKGFAMAGLRPATAVVRGPQARSRDLRRPITRDVHNTRTPSNKKDLPTQLPQPPKYDVNKKDKSLRLMTSPNRFQSRLTLLKREVHMNEKEYQMKIRLKRQINENDDVTSKVWAYIGKRPISVRLNMMTSLHPDVTNDKLTEEEEQVLRMRAANNARKRRR